MKTNLEDNLTLQTAIYDNSLVENTHFNFFQCIHEKDIVGILMYFKENKIAEFTISSKYSNLVDVLALFQEGGYIINGIVEVTNNIRDWHTHEYEKTNAIYLRINKPL